MFELESDLIRLMDLGFDLLLRLATLEISSIYR